MISFSCLMCSTTVTVDEDAQGKTIECPDCSASLRVPEQSVTVSAPVVDKAASPVRGQGKGIRDASDSTSTKSIFRAKRKAQLAAESKGEEFDSSRFEKAGLPRKTMFSLIVILVLAVGFYAYYLTRPIPRLVLTDQKANSLLKAMNTRNDESITSLLDEFLGAQCTSTEMIGEILRYIDTEEKLDEVMDDLKRLSQISLIQNPLVNAIDRDKPNMQLLSLMEEYRGRQASSHGKLEEEVLRIKAINPAMVDRLQKEIPTIALLDMFQG